MHELSPLERRVLEGLGRGDKHEVIAQDIAHLAGRKAKLSVGTVKTVAWRVRRKLHVPTNERAIAKARKAGLIA